MAWVGGPQRAPPSKHRSIRTTDEMDPSVPNTPQAEGALDEAVESLKVALPGATELGDESNLRAATSRMAAPRQSSGPASAERWSNGGKFIFDGPGLGARKTLLIDD